MGINSHQTRSEFLSCSFYRKVIARIGLVLFLPVHPLMAGDLIEKHADWTVSYGEDRKAVVTVTRNDDLMVFGFVCEPSTQPDCTIGAHLPVQCSDSAEVSAKILIDGQMLTAWGAACESADNPKTGKSDRALITSKLAGDSVDELLKTMRGGRWLEVTVETNKDRILKSKFSLAGYSKASSAMMKTLGWRSAEPGGIGGGKSGGDSASSSAKRNLEEKKWIF